MQKGKRKVDKEEVTDEEDEDDDDDEEEEEEEEEEEMPKKKAKKEEPRVPLGSHDLSHSIGLVSTVDVRMY